MRFQLLQQYLDRFLDTRVSAGGKQFRAVDHFDVRADALVFDGPLSIGTHKAERGGEHAAAVGEAGIAGDTNQASPGSCPDDLAQAQLRK